MTRRWMTALVTMITALLPTAVIVQAQQSLSSLSPGTLAVEIVNHKHQLQSPVLGPPGGGLMEIGPTRRLAEWEEPAGVPPLARLRVRSVMEGDAVRIKVSAVFDDSYPVDSPGPKYGARELRLVFIHAHWIGPYFAIGKLHQGDCRIRLLTT